MSKQYVALQVNDDQCEEWPCDTVEEIEAAQQRMREVGLGFAKVMVGEGPDAYANGQILLANDPKEAS